MSDATISQHVAEMTYQRGYRLARGTCGQLWLSPLPDRLEYRKTPCPCGCGPLYRTTWGKSRAKVLK